MNIKTCPKCQAKWVDGQLYWATGAKGDDEDLAGLVCDNYGDETCVNAFKGTKHAGTTWEERRNIINAITPDDK